MRRTASGRSIALTSTPRTSTRVRSEPEPASRSTGTSPSNRSPATYPAPTREPGGGGCCPSCAREHPGAIDVLQPEATLSGDVDDDLRQLVDRDHPVGPQVDRLGEVRPHQAVDALDAVVDVAERPGLLTITPDLDLAKIGRASCREAEETRGDAWGA